MSRTTHAVFAFALSAALLASAGQIAAEDTESEPMTIRSLTDAIASGRLTSTAIVDDMLGRAEESAALNAFITLDAEGARTAAAKADAVTTDRGVLHGIPIVVKDNIVSEGLPTTAGTPALRDFVAGRNAPVLQRLIDAGAILLGKTNLHELAFGITSNNAAFGAVGNAHAPDRFAGGSSGGTAVAIATGAAPAGLGTDTGGSVRIPAALNGIAGLRPTIGRYPQDGIVPISHTRDTAGPMARAVADLVLLDGVITGTPTTVQPIDLATIRLGVPGELNSNLDSETERLMQETLLALESAGVTLVPVEMPALIERNGQVGFPVALWEAGRDLERFLAEWETDLSVADVAAEIASPDVQYVFNELILGDQAIPDDVYRAAIELYRPQLQALYAEVFVAGRLDAIVFPTTPLPAQEIATSDREVMLNGEAVPTFPTFIRNTDPGSNAGIPGLSLPIGLTKDGLPVGMELDAPAHTDRRLLAIGLAIEAVIGRQGVAE